MDIKNHNKIKFNGRYLKLINPITLKWYKYAILLEAIPYYYEDLSSIFNQYDTDGSDYILNTSGECIILIFQAKYGMFTTVRELTQTKLKFYRARVGENFKIIVDNH